VGYNLKQFDSLDWLILIMAPRFYNRNAHASFCPAWSRRTLLSTMKSTTYVTGGCETGKWSTGKYGTRRRSWKCRSDKAATHRRRWNCVSGNRRFRPASK